MMGRVQKLEQELRNAKERSMKDRQTYQAEVDKRARVAPDKEQGIKELIEVVEGGEPTKKKG